MFKVDNVNFNLIGILFCGVVYIGIDISLGMVSSDNVVELFSMMGVDNCFEWVCFMVYDNIFCDGFEMFIEIVDIEGYYFMGDGKLYF